MALRPKYSGVMTITRSDLAPLIDHTLLTPEATREDIGSAIEEAQNLQCGAICIAPSALPIRADGLRVVTVAGFPTGAHESMLKAFESRLAVDRGAVEVDMVINLGAAVARRLDEVLSEIVVVREAIPSPVILKVILESALLLKLPEGETLLRECCLVAQRAGADYVKTSTGFHPAGGASLKAVEIMADAVGGKMGIKAAGGIHTAEQALAFIDAGATRLGTSHTAEVLAGLPE